jgi:density-regulated protein DRP1
MSDFVADSAEGEVANTKTGAGPAMINFGSPVSVVYCPTCTMPCEFCEHGACFEKCLPWIVRNCPEVLNETLLAEMTAKMAISGDEPIVLEKTKQKGGGASAPKKEKLLDTKVVITRVQRQKKKFVTVVGGLETVPDLKVKDASRVFGKKFSSGCSVNESATGAKEVVIQGDVLFDLPNILIAEFKVCTCSRCGMKALYVF